MSDADVGPPDVRGTFGMFVLGTILASLFYGITLLQTGLFLGRSGNERSRLTILVLVLCAFDTMTWILEVYTTWYYFVINYANPAQLAVPFWALKLEPGFTYTVAFIAQMFFIEKIWLLSRSHIIGAFLTFLALGSWGLGLTITGMVFRSNLLANPSIDKVNIGQKTFATLVEVLIAGFMCYLFSSRQTGTRSTDSMLQRLLIFAVSRGVVLCVIEVLYTTMFWGYPDKLYWVLFHFMLGKLCSNSVLASLNVREIMRSGKSTNSNSMVLHSTGPSRSGVASPQSHLASTRIVFRRDSNPGTELIDTKLYQSHGEGPSDLESGSGVHVATEYYKAADP